MSRKNKELGLNQSITNERVDNDIRRDETNDKFKDMDNSENRFKDAGFNEKEYMHQLKERDLDDINKSEAISEVCNTSMISNIRENIPNESETSSSRENIPQYLEMTDFIMSINDSEVKINKEECFDELDKNSLELPEAVGACTESRISKLVGACKDTKMSKFIEKKSDYLNMSDVKPSPLEEAKHTYLLNISDRNMSINTSEVKLNESLVQTDKTSGFSLRETNSVNNVSIQICNNGNKISQDFRKQTNPNQSRTVENVNPQTRTDHVDLVTESISYMSFTEDTSSPCRVTNGTHQYKNPIKESQKIIIETLTTLSQSSPDKFSRRNHQIDYTQFAPNNLAWNTSSPLMRYNPQSSLLRVNPARVSNTPNCESPLRVKYHSRPERRPLRVKNNSSRFDGNYPGLPRDNLIAPKHSSITPNVSSIAPRDNLIVPNVSSIPPRDNLIAPKVSSIARQLNSSSMRDVNQAAGVSFDMDDFEFDEGMEDLSGIIDNIIRQ